MEVVYGHRVISDDDVYLRLVERSVRLSKEVDSVGATIIDLFPFRKCSSIIQQECEL